MTGFWLPCISIHIINKFSLPYRSFLCGQMNGWYTYIWHSDRRIAVQCSCRNKNCQRARYKTSNLQNMICTETIKKFTLIKRQLILYVLCIYLFCIYFIRKPDRYRKHKQSWKDVGSVNVLSYNPKLRQVSVLRNFGHCSRHTQRKPAWDFQDVQAMTHQNNYTRLQFNDLINEYKYYSTAKLHKSNIEINKTRGNASG